MIKLEDFFIYFDKNNLNQIEAIKLLEKVIPENELQDDSEWIIKYRTKEKIKEEKIIKPILKEETYQTNWNNMNSHITKDFTVGENLRYDFKRIPKTEEIKTNIIKLTFELQKIRNDWGSGITITSGYRPPAVNKAVGGVSNSQHLTGLAVDIYPSNGEKLRFEEYILDNWHGGVGKGMKKRGFVHIDARAGFPCWKKGKPTAIWFY